MKKKFENIKLVEYKKLTYFKNIFLLLTIIFGICFLSLSTGGITDNPVTWFFFKLCVNINLRRIIMGSRIGNFIIFLILSVLTLGIYPFYFHVTRQQETIDVLNEIKDELKRLN